MKRNSSRHLALAAADGDALGFTAQTDAAAGDDQSDQESPSSVGPVGSGERISDMPRRDVVQYIAEMCDASAYMASAHQCNDLADLLHEAAAQADRCEPGK